MSKATSTTNTAVPANIPGLPSTSRRRLLAGSGVATLAAAFALPLATSPVHAAPVDPVITLYAKWRALEDAETIVSKRQEELRAYFVSRYGELKGSQSTHQAWGSDPQHSELTALTRQCIDMCSDSTNALDALAETPATSLQGIYCKLLATISLLQSIESPHVEMDFHDTIALAVLRDAARVLAGSAVA